MDLSAEKASPINNLENKEAITKHLTTEPQSFDTMLGKVNALPGGDVPPRVTKKQALSLFKDLLQHQKDLQEHNQGAILHQERLPNYFDKDGF